MTGAHRDRTYTLTALLAHPSRIPNWWRLYSSALRNDNLGVPARRERW